MIRAVYRAVVALAAIFAFAGAVLSALFLSSLVEGVPTPRCYPSCSAPAPFFNMLFWSAIYLALVQISLSVIWVRDQNRRALLVLAGLPVYALGALMVATQLGKMVAWPALVLLLALVTAGGFWSVRGKAPPFRQSAIAGQRD